MYQLLAPIQKKVYRILLQNYVKGKTLISKRVFGPSGALSAKIAALTEQTRFETLVEEQTSIDRNDRQNRFLTNFEEK